MNVFVNDKICYISDRYFALFIALFICRQIQLFILWPFLTWCLFKGFGKSLQTVLFRCRRNLHVWLELTVGKRSVCLHMGRNISSLISQRRRRGHVSMQEKRLCPNDSQVILWGTSVVIFFWRAIKDYMSAFVIQNKSNVLDKMVVFSALFDKTAYAWETQLCNSFWFPSSAFFMQFENYCHLKKGECDRNEWLKEEKRWGWGRLEIQSIKEEIGRDVCLTHTLQQHQVVTSPLPAVFNTWECPLMWCDCCSLHRKGGGVLLL